MRQLGGGWLDGVMPSAANPLLAPSILPFSLPDYAVLDVASYSEALEGGMREHLNELREIGSAEDPATVQNVLEAMERAGATLDRALSAWWVVKAAETNDELDALDEEFAPLLSAHSDAVLLDPALHGRLVALAARRDAGELELDDEAAYLLERRLNDDERGGIQLGASEQARLRELNGELATLSTRFEQLLVAGREAAGVHVVDEAELDGLSAADRAGCAESAHRRGVPGWVVDLTNTTGQAALEVLHHRGLRERVFQASIRRGLSGPHDTRAVLLSIARARAERATLLGFAHHAAYVAADGCAGSTESVDAMLARLSQGAVGHAEREAAELAERFARIEPGATFEAWDWQYVANVVRQEQDSLDGAALRPYLELENVLTEGVFAAATALYGLTFHARPELRGYTEDARVYEVREEDGEVLGAFILDPYTRPTKQGGAWMTSLVTQSGLLGDAPVVTNTCNFPRPAPGQPSLLTWDNVITLFHEFGHDLHGLLSDARYPSRSGTAVPQDFVEFPSQVNEVWALAPALLKRYAVHHETGEAMPAAWIEVLREGVPRGVGYDKTESLKAMLLDQAWYQTSADQLPVDVDDVEGFEDAALAAAGGSFPLVPPRYRSAYFHHIFGGGYSAAYYSYIWSEIMDADTVAWFEEHGGLDRDAGEQFRRSLLARGGSIDSMTAYREFRGADPDVAHLLARMGVTE